MRSGAPRRSVARVMGFGAAACAACCAGPVLGFLATAGLLTAGSLALFGVAGLLVVVPAVWFRRRRAHRSACATPTVVPVELASRPADAILGDGPPPQRRSPLPR